MSLVKIFWKKDCPRCPKAKALGAALEQAGCRVDYVDVETPDGLADAAMHDIRATPSFVLEDDSGKTIRAWPGEIPEKAALLE